MSKVPVTFQPGEAVSRVPAGTTLFHAAHWAGIPISSICGGRGTCGTCKVRVLEHVEDPTPADHRKLGANELDDGWRLSCQLQVRRPTACEVPPLEGAPKAATLGVGRFVQLEPDVHRVEVPIVPPTLGDARSHLHRLLDALEVEGFAPRHDAATLSSLAAAMREEPTRLTATIVGDHLVEVVAGSAQRPLFGIALDIGTTTIVVKLVDLATGAVGAVETALNGQAKFGADVIGRIGHAMDGPAAVGELRTAVVETVNELVGRACAAAGASPRDVVQVLVAGNATMLHLLLGADPRSIALAPFAATFLEPQDLRASELGLGIHPEARVVLLPSIGAYVGADIVADLVATGLARGPHLRLLVDVGTNGEIVCGSSERVVATAAPAGPAFEGGQILHGMRATDGAIEGVSLRGGEVELSVIGDRPPRGLCGSGLIDVVAELRLVGLLGESGGLASRAEALAHGHPLADRLVEHEGVRAFALTDEVVLTQLDVRELQSAKGAIATGIEVAMGALDVEPGDLDEVLLAGSFGTYVDPASARILGLVPPVPVERIRAVGNAASEGATMSLLSFREREIAFDLPTVVEYLELSATEDFNDRFVRNLAFPALEGVGA